jgi:hypothetical protein
MRRAVILAAALLLVTATVAQARGGPDVSGTYTYDLLGGASTVSIAAWEDGRGTFTFARDNGVYMAGNLTCVFIKGADAQVWGVVTSAVNTPFTFWGARVRDGGLPDGGGDMALSFADMGEPPANCRIPPAWGQTGGWMVPITSGDIRVD